MVNLISFATSVFRVFQFFLKWRSTGIPKNCGLKYEVAMHSVYLYVPDSIIVYPSGYIPGYKRTPARSSPSRAHIVLLYASLI